MRRVLLSATCLILPAAAFLLGCESDRGQRASASDVGAAVAPSAGPLPTTITHDHQPPPRTPEN